MISSLKFSGSKTALLAMAISLALIGCGGDKPEAMVASARDYLAKNDPKAAIIQLKNALQNNPDLPEARLLLGQALLRSGDPVGAETELRKALALKHPAELVVPTLARTMLAQGQFKKLTDEFGTTDMSQPNSQADLKSSVAAAFASQGKREMSDAAINASLGAVPNYAPALLAQARAKAVARDYDGAVIAVDSVLASAPNNHEAWKLRGDLQLLGNKNSSDAIASYRKAVEAKSDYADGHVGVISNLLRGGKLDDAEKQLGLMKAALPNAFQTRYFETLIAFQKKDFKRAMDLSQQLLKMAPESALALQMAGAVEMQLNSFLQADAHLSKALKAAPDAVLVRRLLVTTYLKSGQFAKAIETLTPLLKDPNSTAETNALAGEAYLRAGDPVKAEEFFAKAAKQDPKNIRSRTALALTQIEGGKQDVALSELQVIAASDSGDTADLALISALLRRNEWEKALKAIDVLEKKQPDKPLAASLRGRTLMAKRDLQGARKSFERSVAIDPTYFPSIASLAAMDVADKRPDDARKRFESVLAKDPKSLQALLALAELAARAGAPKEQVAELINKAIVANPTEKAPRILLVDLYLQSKDAKLALSAAQNAIGAISDSPEVLDALGRAQLASGETNQALVSFNKVAAMQPSSPLPQLRLADAYSAAKNLDASAASLRKALDIKPDLKDAQRGLMVLAVEGKRFDEAVLIAKSIQKQRPKDADGYRFEADIAASQRKWDVAADALRNGLKQVASSALAAKLHTVLRASGKIPDAEKFAAGWLKDNARDMTFRLYMGDVSAAVKDYLNAEKMYISVVQIDPKNAVALNNLAWVTGKLQKEGAIAYAERALALAPNQPSFMDTLAVLYSEKNNYAKALEWQTKAVALSPQVPIYRLNLAKIHIKGGKKDLARKELDELAKLGNKFAGQAEVASLLGDL